MLQGTQFWLAFWIFFLLPEGVAILGWSLGRRPADRKIREGEEGWVSISRFLTAICCAIPPLRVLVDLLPEALSRKIDPILVPSLIVLGLATGAAGLVCSFAAFRRIESLFASAACLLAIVETLMLAYAGLITI